MPKAPALILGSVSLSVPPAAGLKLRAPAMSGEISFLFLQYPHSNPWMGDLQGIAVSVLDVRGTWIGVGERLAPAEWSPECTVVLLSPNRDGGCHSLPQNATGCAHLTLTPLYPCPGPHRRGEGHDRSWASPLM